jgi:hypothetical protein
VDWIDLAQDRDQWRALVNTIVAAQLLASQEGLRSMDLAMYSCSSVSSVLLCR